MLHFILFCNFQQIDALDQYDDLTELGHHLVDLPVEPRYGKMVLYSVVLKCLDPILTIACALAYRDPCEYHCFRFRNYWVLGTAKKKLGIEIIISKIFYRFQNTFKLARWNILHQNVAVWCILTLKMQVGANMKNKLAPKTVGVHNWPQKAVLGQWPGSNANFCGALWPNVPSALWPLMACR